MTQWLVIKYTTAILNINTYILFELNEVQLAEMFAKNYLKFFRIRESCIEKIKKILNQADSLDDEI